MRPPAFFEEIRAEAYRPRLLSGIRWGYAIALYTLALIAVAHLVELIPWHPIYYLLIAAKLLSNGLFHLAVRRRVAVVEVATVNAGADLALITTAVYLTGDVASPLFPLYVVWISLMALLTNRRLTVLAALLAGLAYAGMVALVQGGILAAHPSPVQYAGGTTGGYVLVFLPFWLGALGGITYYMLSLLAVLRRREHDLEARSAELVEANKLRVQLMNNVTHELRTPLQGIRGLTQLLSEGLYGPLSAKQTEALGGVDYSARALIGLVDDLLTVARSDAGKLPLERRPVTVDELVERCVAASRWLLGKKRLTVEVEVERPLELVSDRAKIEHILTNLLVNAIKFTPDEGRISVSARRVDAAAVVIEVADTGIGIPPEEVPRIFDEFRQVDGSFTRQYGGVGLGLALVKRLVDALEGTIEVESQVGRGTTFRVQLPALDGALPSAPRRPRGATDEGEDRQGDAGEDHGAARDLATGG